MGTLETTLLPQRVRTFQGSKLNIHHMKYRFFLLFLLTLCFVQFAQAQLKSPDAFLPHKLGTQFTPHEMLVEYVRHVAANSPNVKLMEYGRTNEQRPLLLLFVSSPDNLSKLEQIRQNNLKRAGILEGQPDPSMEQGIVWISFNVHGNEAAGSESSMAVLHALADPSNTRTQSWLKNTVVVLDPCINPDGQTRYTNWYRIASNRLPDPRPEAREHQEPWPGGRTNHYHFDLNRDWAWQTQVESRQRIPQYNAWLPHVHVDMHEQGYNAPYYFAPAAQPYHTFITSWQRDFQVTIGRNNAKYFDQNGWLYFTREVFDLLYPSYGDTYPTYNGAVGMTYEQGGIGAGRAVLLRNGDTLTLLDRVTHHTTSALATIETTSQNTSALNQQFAAFFQKARTNPPGEYKTYIIKGSNPVERIKAFCETLDRNQIRYGRAGKPGSLSAYNYQNGQTTTVKIEAGDLLVSAFQPRGVMTQVLLDPEAVVVDSVTYDITSWSLPYAYGLETYASKQRMDPSEPFDFAKPAPLAASSARPYAYLLRWNALNHARFLAAVLQKGVKVRFANEPFTLGGQAYARGTLVMTRGDNRKMEDGFDQVVTMLASQHQQEVIPVQTGFADTGRDFGSSSYSLIQTPRIAVLSGEQTFGNEFGQVWYFLEQDLKYPLTVLDANRLERFDLANYNVLILPEGRYWLSEGSWEKINTWVAAGGRLIAIGEAVGALEGRKGFALTASNVKDENPKAHSADAHAETYGDQERRQISSSIPGAIFKVKMDVTHPLAYGVSSDYFSLKTGTMAYTPLKNAWNVGTIGEQLMISGFAGSKAKEAQKNTVVFAVEGKGSGSVIYLVDNPLFRAFWENGKFLFSNALFFAGF